MPGLDAYTVLAPFQMEELVDAANSILRDRPRLHVSKRTVRYYVAQSILPAPRGAPKFARYTMEHLARLVGARLLQEDGRNLEEVSDTLARMFRRGEAGGVLQVQQWLDGGSHSSRPVGSTEPLRARESYVAESQPLLARSMVFELTADASAPSPSGASIPIETLKFELTRDTTLEVRRDRPLEIALEEALKALSEVLQTIRTNQ